MSDEATRADDRPLQFSLYYFASDEGGGSAEAKRRLLFESARFADANGFCAVWVPDATSTPSADCRPTRR